MILYLFFSNKLNNYIVCITKKKVNFYPDTNVSEPFFIVNDLK